MTYYITRILKDKEPEIYSTWGKEAVQELINFYEFDRKRTFVYDEDGKDVTKEFIFTK